MLNEKKVVLKLWQEVKVKVDIVTSDDIKIYYTGKFQDFTARYIIKPIPTQQNFGPDQLESICRRQIKCNKNDNFCL